jgi:hypothetical protein
MLTVIDKNQLAHRRGGKPDRPPVVRRTHCVSVRLDATELSNLDSRRGSMQRGEWMRSAALSKPPVVIPEMNSECVRLLSNLANNVNQIAHHTNMGEAAIGLSEAIAEIKSLRKMLIGGAS